MQHATPFEFTRRGALASLYNARRALIDAEHYFDPELYAIFEWTKDLLKLSESKVKEPVRFIMGKSVCQ